MIVKEFEKPAQFHCAFHLFSNWKPLLHTLQSMRNVTPSGNCHTAPAIKGEYFADAIAEYRDVSKHANLPASVGGPLCLSAILDQGNPMFF